MTDRFPRTVAVIAALAWLATIGKMYTVPDFSGPWFFLFGLAALDATVFFMALDRGWPRD